VSTRVRGNVRGLQGLRARLKAIPATAALETARQGAPAITGEAGGAYDAGLTVYGSARPQGRRGFLTLVRSGATRSMMRFVSDGTTTIRASLGTRYAKYLIGKYQILPSGGGAALPASWKQRLSDISMRICGEAVGEGL